MCQKYRLRWLDSLSTYIEWLALHPLYILFRSCSLKASWLVTVECLRQAQSHFTVVCYLTSSHPEHAAARHPHCRADLRMQSLPAAVEGVRKSRRVQSHRVLVNFASKLQDSSGSIAYKGTQYCTIRIVERHDARSCRGRGDSRDCRYLHS